MRRKGKSRKVKAETLRPHFWPLAFAFCLFAFVLPGCGRKALLKAPEDVLPERITDLAANNAPDGIQLSWSRPRAYVDGSRMTDLGGFVIERAATAAPRPTFERISVLDVDDRDRFRQIKQFRYLDRDTTVGTQYSYRVVSFTIDRYFSGPSNVVTVEHAITGEDKHASLPAARWRTLRGGGPAA